MDAREVIEGGGLTAFGVGFYAWMRWFVRDESRLIRVARSRWGFDRRVTRKLRSGEITQDEWFSRWVRSQRVVVRWFVTPVICLFLALSFATFVHGLLAA